jgi:shikimate dehydrogenase
MAKAVAAALHGLGFAQGTIVARNQPRGEALAKAYGYRWSADLPESPPLADQRHAAGHGRRQQRRSGLPQDWIEACQTAFDVVAQPADTPFLKAAEALGKTIISGAEVIVLQAVEQFVLYTGRRPWPQQIRAAAALAHGEAVAASWHCETLGRYNRKPTRPSPRQKASACPFPQRPDIRH